MSAKGENSEERGRAQNRAQHRERIDLGLGAILAGLQADQGAAGCAEEPGADGSAWTLGDTPQPARCELDDLADQRRWGEIVARVEDRLAQRRDFEARLWWIRGHLGAFSMPVSLLVAPLESVCGEMVECDLKPSLRGLLKETGLLTLSRLEEVGEVASADNLRRLLLTLGVEQPRDIEGRKRAGTSSFRASDFIPAVSEVVDQAPGSALHVASEGSNKTSRDWPFERLLERFLTGAHSLRGASLVIIVAFAVYLLLARASKDAGLNESALQVATEAFISSPLDAQLDGPIVNKREPGGRLGALFYAIGEGTPALQPSANIASQSVDAVGDAIAPPKRKEEIDTQGPLEGADFKDRVDGIDQSDRKGRSVPKIKRNEIVGGPPQAVLPGMAAEGFETEHTYRVLESTSVLSAPRFGARTIGDLDRGDRVVVDGKLGRWLRLRARSGRGGYILAGDVEEIVSEDR